MKYGDKRDYPKIDIYQIKAPSGFVYVCSTTWAKTCKEAVQKFAEAREEPKSFFKANYSN